MKHHNDTVEDIEIWVAGDVGDFQSTLGKEYPRVVEIIKNLIEAERLRAVIRELENCSGFSYKRLRIEELKAELDKLENKK